MTTSVGRPAACCHDAPLRRPRHEPFAASAPGIGSPRWDTMIIGLDWDTTILDERLRRRTDAMFEAGLVEEVKARLKMSP